MRFDFIRGLIAGSLLGALLSMLIETRQTKKKRNNLLRRVYARRPRSATQRLIKGMSMLVR